MAPPTKRTLEEGESLLEGVKALVLDIEGTIAPTSFVKDKLFPYVTENVESYLTTRYDEEETQADISALRELANKDKEEGKDVVEIPAKTDDNKDAVIKAVVDNVKALMDADRKSTELKTLQGHMWREAYKTKKVEGELFEDVAPVLQQLAEEDFMLYIYSSGSVEAQKLLLAHSTDGDITDMFTGYFDSTMGPKTESSSYEKIKKSISEELADDIQSGEILYLTDSPAEAKAACEAKWQAVLVDRSMEQEGGAEFTDEDRHNFMVIENLNDLFGEDDDDEEALRDVKRARMDNNGEFAGDDDDDDEDDEDDGGEDEEAGYNEEGEDDGAEEDEEEA